MAAPHVGDSQLHMSGPNWICLEGLLALETFVCAMHLSPLAHFCTS